VMIPPDLGTFLTQASQQGFNPRFITVGKAALFPSVIESIGDNLGDGVTSEIWWSPHHPFISSLTQATPQELAAAFADTGKQWTQPLGFAHALFEVAADVLKRTTDLEDKNAIVTAIKATNLNTIVGPVSWSGGPFPNVAKTPLVGGQWRPGRDYPFDLVITVNGTAPNIPVGAGTLAMPWSA